MYFLLKNQLPLEDDPEGYSHVHLGIDFYVQ